MDKKTREYGDLIKDYAEKKYKNVFVRRAESFFGGAPRSKGI